MADQKSSSSYQSPVFSEVGSLTNNNGLVPKVEARQYAIHIATKEDGDENVVLVEVARRTTITSAGPFCDRREYFMDQHRSVHRTTRAQAEVQASPTLLLGNGEDAEASGREMILHPTESDAEPSYTTETVNAPMNYRQHQGEYMAKDDVGNTLALVPAPSNALVVKTQENMLPRPKYPKGHFRGLVPANIYSPRKDL